MRWHKDVWKIFKGGKDVGWLMKSYAEANGFFTSDGYWDSKYLPTREQALEALSQHLREKSRVR